jgi:transcriptional regulator with XRE-family HTH domain
MPPSNKPATYHFAANLRALRLARGLSQYELAAKLGVINQTVSRWEQMTSEPPATQLLKIATFFNVSVHELLTTPTPHGTQTEDALKRFEQTHYGRVAAERGWLQALRAFPTPFEPTAELYEDIVHVLQRHMPKRKPADK